MQKKKVINYMYRIRGREQITYSFSFHINADSPLLSIHYICMHTSPPLVLVEFIFQYEEAIGLVAVGEGMVIVKTDRSGLSWAPFLSCTNHLKRRSMLYLKIYEYAHVWCMRISRIHRASALREAVLYNGNVTGDTWLRSSTTYWPW